MRKHVDAIISFLRGHICVPDRDQKPYERAMEIAWYKSHAALVRSGEIPARP